MARTRSTRRFLSAPRLSLGAPGAVVGLLGLLLAGGPRPGRAQAPAASAGGRPPVAEAGAVRRNVLKLTPLVALGQQSAFYERSLNERVAVVAGYGVGGRNRAFGQSQGPGDFTYRRGTVELRRYWKKGLRGWYAGPYLRVGTLRESYSYYLPPGPPGPVGWREQQALLWTPGVMLGHQLLTRWLAVDTFLGLQSTQGGDAWVGANSVPEAMASPALAVRVGLSVGVPF